MSSTKNLRLVADCELLMNPAPDAFRLCIRQSLRRTVWTRPLSTAVVNSSQFVDGQLHLHGNSWWRVHVRDCGVWKGVENVNACFLWFCGRVRQLGFTGRLIF